MREEIVIDVFDIASIRKAQKFLDRFAVDLNEKADKLCKRLADIGLDIARVYFIPESWSGNDDVSLSVEPCDGGYMVVASGEDVCFLEFGAGVTAGQGYDTGVYEPPVDISPGSWSRTKGTGKYDADGYWYYNRQRYTGYVPQMGMYHVAKELRERAADIVKEVFRD